MAEQTTNWKQAALDAYDAEQKQRKENEMVYRLQRAQKIAERLEKIGIPRSEMDINVDTERVVVSVGDLPFSEWHGDICLLTNCIDCGQLVRASNAIYDLKSLGDAIKNQYTYNDVLHTCRAVYPREKSTGEQLVELIQQITAAGV